MEQLHERNHEKIIKGTNLQNLHQNDIWEIKSFMAGIHFQMVVLNDHISLQKEEIKNELAILKANMAELKKVAVEGRALLRTFACI